MEELQRVKRQSGVVLETGFSDYDLHAAMVNLAEEKNRASKNLNKMLDRKYQRWVKHLSKCKSNDELTQHWKDAFESGDIAGCFWAIMSHPHSGSDLILRTYEEIHMLSHLQGASHRNDRQRVAKLETEIESLQETLAKNRHKHHEQISRRDEIIRQNEERLLFYQSNQQSQINDQSNEAELSKENTELNNRLEWTETQLANAQVQNSHLQQQINGLKELLDETRDEHQSMEHALQSLLALQSHEESPQADEVNLDGKRILYLGGRTKLAPHLRSLVEAHNGEFIHHDGGLEESRLNLQCALASADMVFCPIDCISHDACLRAKQHCQQSQKQFIPLRSSGISAFSAGLIKTATPEAQAMDA